MSRYVVHVRTPMSPREAFAYMADLRNFAQWDPGVKKVEQVAGDGHGPDTAFEVSVKGVAGSTLDLRYEVTEYDEPERFVAVAKSPLLKSVDTVTVRPEGDGSIVTYDAELTLNGLLGLADPLLGIAFKTIGDRAAKGLVKHLDGAKVRQPSA